MRTTVRFTLLFLFAACAAMAWGASVDPYIAYVYPAGGQRGTVFTVTVAGQVLRGASAACVSGTGVEATILDYVGPAGRLSNVQEEELRRRIEYLMKKNQALADKSKLPDPYTQADQPEVVLPDLPELRNLEQMTNPQLRMVFDQFINREKRPKSPMDEEVTLEITIDPAAATGNRELRLQTPAGLTNPVVFQVGSLPEQREPGRFEQPPVNPAPPLSVPAVLNGQIMPGEVDQYRLRLRGGQNLVFAAQARKLIPYLADAVPGWIQAIMAIAGPSGEELAFADDNGSDPDPFIFFTAPEDGVYTLSIRDSIYRGRLDFVYRIEIGEPGGMPKPATAAAKVGSDESEPNDLAAQAQTLALPCRLSGRISRAGDVDIYQFSGKAGQFFVAEITARRTGSLLDSLLRLTDSNGTLVAMNDDTEDKEMGLMTWHSDSYLRVKLPATGSYFLQVSDATRQGGENFGYSLRAGPPIEDFALLTTKSAINIPATGIGVFTVQAVRKDGWDGEIEVVLKDGSRDFILDGGIIPKGRESVRMTLKARGTSPDSPVVISLEGRAVIAGVAVTHPVVPADRMMQAFANTHLVHAQELMVAFAKAGARAPDISLAVGNVLRLPSGGAAEVAVTVQPKPRVLIRAELVDPPAGVTLKEVKNTQGGMVLVFAADDRHSGYADNLIVAVFTEIEVKDKAGVARTQKVALGLLPAIRFEIVK